MLADGTNTYLYGLDRIGQYAGTDAQYFLTDALGSVRQLTDPNGVVTLSQSFDPFGNILDQSGTGTSSFGYAGEQTDTTGLQFLRARYYAPTQGRFLTKDTYRGIAWQPASLNGYDYSKNNPVNYNDPSGYWPVPVDPNQIIRDAVAYLKSIGQTIVEDPTVKSVYANGVDIVSQKINET